MAKKKEQPKNNVIEIGGKREAPKSKKVTKVIKAEEKKGDK